VLAAAGVIEERLAGRERRVRLTPSGHALVAGWAAADPPSDPPGAPADDPPGERHHTAMLAALATSRQHSRDRPRFHLRHAAMLALASLRHRGIANAADEHYQEVLIGLINEDSSSEKDLDRFYRLQRSWPAHDHRRILLAENIVRFQHEAERRSSPPDFSLVSDLLEPGDADTVLWASGAIDMAHQYLLEPRNHLDRVAARGLLHTATRLMRAALQIPKLAIASAYRLGKVARVAAGSWTWQPPSATPAAPPRDPLDQEIADADQIVLLSAEFNDVLEGFDQTLTKHVQPWIMRAMPSTESFFRITGGPGLTAACEQWARSEAGQLADSLVGRGRSDPAIRSELEAFLRDGEPYLNTQFSKLVRPHLNQARALLGLPPLAESPDSAIPYSALLLNNYWTPEMVASDVIVSRSNPEEPV
jgi:hypothetical protein